MVSWPRIEWADLYVRLIRWRNVQIVTRERELGNTSRPMKKNSLRRFSTILIDGPDRAPSGALLYPVGFKPDDFSKPIIGIAST
jgi:hypothetical protein